MGRGGEGRTKRGKGDIRVGGRGEREGQEERGGAKVCEPESSILKATF